MMKSAMATYSFKKFINQVVDSTESSPSLAEMVQKHLEVDWSRQRISPYWAVFAVHDKRERLLELRVTDARQYLDDVYRRGAALLRIGVNGALVSPEDEEWAHAVFRQETFRTCRQCGARFERWLDYYGHAKLEHWGGQRAG